MDVFEKDNPSNRFVEIFLKSDEENAIAMVCIANRSKETSIPDEDVTKFLALETPFNEDDHIWKDATPEAIQQVNEGMSDGVAVMCPACVGLESEAKQAMEAFTENGTDIKPDLCEQHKHIMTEHQMCYISGIDDELFDTLIAERKNGDEANLDVPLYAKEMKEVPAPIASVVMGELLEPGFHNMSMSQYKLFDLLMITFMTQGVKTFQKALDEAKSNPEKGAESLFTQSYLLHADLIRKRELAKKLYSTLDRVKERKQSKSEQEPAPDGAEEAAPDGATVH